MKVPVLLVTPVWLTLMPAFEKLKISQFSTLSLAGREVDAVDAERGPRAVNREVAQNDDDGVGRGCRAVVDVDAVRGAGEDRAEARAVRAVDGDVLRDGDGAEPARIERVNLAARRGLRDGTGEGLTGGRAAARVDIVADA
jgi:hypothetical protein